MKKIVHQPIINQKEIQKSGKTALQDSDFDKITSEVLAFLPVPCLILKTDFTVLYYNQEVFKLLNIPDALLAHADFLQTLHLKEKEQKFIRNKLKNMVLNDVFSFVFQLNQSEIKYTMLIKKNKAKKGEVYFVNLVQQQLDANFVKEQELSMILKSSLIATWVFNLDDFTFKINNFSKMLFPKIKTAIFYLIEDFTKLIYQEDIERVQKAILEAAEKHTELDIEFRVLNQQNYPVYLAMRGHMLKHNADKHYLAGILIDVTEKKNLQKQAENLRLNQQRVILDATYWAQEKERKKISEVLHDSVSQLLYGIRLNIQGLQLSGFKNEAFVNINRLLDQAVKETRAIAYDLKPSILIDFGFVTGVKELAERLSTANFNIKAYVNTLSDKLHSEVQLSLFRIIQELLNNIIKHAQATTSEIIVFTDEEKVDLSVHDNGKGFDAKHPEILRGSGIREIKNKVFLLNGTLNIQSKKGKGTHIAIRFRIADAIAALSVI